MTLAPPQPIHVEFEITQQLPWYNQYMFLDFILLAISDTSVFDGNKKSH